MELKVELRADHVNAALAGPLSLDELPRAFEAAYNAAFEQGLRFILIDCSELDGKMSTTDRFLLGNSGIDYWSSRSWKMIPKIAVVGEAPLIEMRQFGSGFAVRSSSSPFDVASDVTVKPCGAV